MKVAAAREDSQARRSALTPSPRWDKRRAALHDFRNKLTEVVGYAAMNDRRLTEFAVHEAELMFLELYNRKEHT